MQRVGLNRKFRPFFNLSQLLYTHVPYAFKTPNTLDCHDMSLLRRHIPHYHAQSLCLKTTNISTQANEMDELLFLAQDIAKEGVISHGANTNFPVEDGDQRFSASTGVLEIRIASHGGYFSWGILNNALAGVELYCHLHQRFYKTWFEFWPNKKRTSGMAMGRGKLFNVVNAVDER